MRAGSLRRAASRRGSSDCVGRLRRAAARRAQQTACRPDTGSCSWSGVTGDRARPGSNFLAISAGEGEGGWFPAPQPRIVGGGATPGAGEGFRIDDFRHRLVVGEFSFITVRCYTRALRRDPQDAKGMTTEVYPRENCIAPDMCCIVYEPGSPRTQEVEGWGCRGQGRSL